MVLVKSQPETTSHSLERLIHNFACAVFQIVFIYIMINLYTDDTGFLLDLVGHTHKLID